MSDATWTTETRDTMGWIWLHDYTGNRVLLSTEGTSFIEAYPYEKGGDGKTLALTPGGEIKLRETIDEIAAMLQGDDDDVEKDQPRPPLS